MTPETESERYASEQSAPTEEETCEAGEFKYPRQGLVQETC